MSIALNAKYLYYAFCILAQNMDYIDGCDSFIIP